MEEHRESFSAREGEARSLPKIHLSWFFKSVSKAIKEECKELPEELRLKKVELNRTESRVHNFIEFVAQGRATKGLVEALEEAEKSVDKLKVDLESLERAKGKLFEPPPKEWIAHQLVDVKSVLEKKTEQSALLLRKYRGDVRLEPTKPDIGKLYYRALGKVTFVPLLDGAAKGSNSLQWWTRAGSNR